MAQVGDDVGEVVGDPGRDGRLAGLVGVEDLRVDVDRLQEAGEVLAEFVGVRLEARVGLVALVGDDVLMGAEAAAGQEQLGDLQEEEGDRQARLVALRDLRDGYQEALDLIRDLDHEIVRVVVGRVQRGVRHLGVVSPRRRDRGSPRPRIPGRHPPGGRWPGG